jgi:hypothetical protein
LIIILIIHDRNIMREHASEDGSKEAHIIIDLRNCATENRTGLRLPRESEASA